MNIFSNVLIKFFLTSSIVLSTFASNSFLNQNDIIFEKSNTIQANSTMFLNGQSYNIEISKSGLIPRVKLHNNDFQNIFYKPKFRIRLPDIVRNPFKPIVKVTICHKEFKINLVDIVLCEQASGAVAATCTTYGVAGCIPAIALASKMCGISFDEINNACKNI